jgi:hypothetical protein
MELTLEAELHWIEFYAHCGVVYWELMGGVVLVIRYGSIGGYNVRSR